jgi:hypothetical protein
MIKIKSIFDEVGRMYDNMQSANKIGY